MNFFRKILFPLAILYGWVTGIRNWLFDKGLLKSYTFELPVIAVGNLSVGGTGKTPQIEYLIRLLSDKYKVATLSRGYKRLSKGFVLAGTDSDAALLGDEPFQFHQKFPNITVAVDAERKNGIEQLLNLDPKPEVILLDDAFQHRKVKAGLYILLTAYGDLYADDFLLPTGNLREGRKGAKRAAIVIVTKCPANLAAEAQKAIREKLKLSQNQQLYFSAIAYDTKVFAEERQLEVSEIKQLDKLLLAGIAKPEPFFNHLKRDGDKVLEFPDHHHFSEQDIAMIKTKAQGRPIVTTEKDFVRLKGLLPKEQLFYLPINTRFLAEGTRFNDWILDFTASRIK